MASLPQETLLRLCCSPVNINSAGAWCWTSKSVNHDFLIDILLNTWRNSIVLKPQSVCFRPHIVCNWFAMALWPINGEKKPSDSEEWLLQKRTMWSEKPCSNTACKIDLDHFYYVLRIFLICYELPASAPSCLLSDSLLYKNCLVVAHWGGI